MDRTTRQLDDTEYDINVADVMIIFARIFVSRETLNVFLARTRTALQLIHPISCPPEIRLTHGTMRSSLLDLEKDLSRILQPTSLGLCRVLCASCFN